MGKSRLIIAANAISGADITLDHINQINRLVVKLLADGDAQIVELWPLTQGISHASYRVKLQSEHGQAYDWVVRLMGEQPHAWLVQQVELQLLVHLSRFQITAPVVGCDVNGQWLVTEFVEGRHPRDHLHQDPSFAWLADLAACFKQLDAINLPDALCQQLPRLDLSARCWQLFDGIGCFPDFIARPTFKLVLDYFAQLDLSAVQSESLCHCDLHQGNMLITATGVKLLDWEYASMGARLIDVAAVCQDLALDQQQIEYLLAQAGYQGWQDELVHFALAYRLIELLWYLQADNLSLLPAKQLEAKWQHLLACWLQSQNA